MSAGKVYQKRKQKNEDISIARQKHASCWVPQTLLKRKSEERSQCVYVKRQLVENGSRISFLERVAKQEGCMAIHSPKRPTQLGPIDRVSKKEENWLRSSGLIGSDESGNSACIDTGLPGKGIYEATDVCKRESRYSCRESANGVFNWEEKVKVPENIMGCCDFSPSCEDLNKSPTNAAFTSGLAAADQQRGSVVCFHNDSYGHSGERVFNWKENKEVIGDTHKGFNDLNESGAIFPLNEFLPLTGFSPSTSQVSGSEDNSLLLFGALSTGQVQGAVERRKLDSNSDYAAVTGRRTMENDGDRLLVAKDRVADMDLENHSNNPIYDPEKDVRDDMVSLAQYEKLQKVDGYQPCAEALCFPSTPIQKDKTTKRAKSGMGLNRGLRKISNIKEYRPKIAAERENKRNPKHTIKAATPKLVSPRKPAKKSRSNWYIKTVKCRRTNNRSRNKENMVSCNQNSIAANSISDNLTNGNIVAVQQSFEHDSGINNGEELKLSELKSIFYWKTRGKRSMRYYLKRPHKKNHFQDQISYWSSCRRFGPIIICLNTCRKLLLNFPKNCKRKRGFRRRKLHIFGNTSVVSLVGMKKKICILSPQSGSLAMVTENPEGNEVPNSFHENEIFFEVMEQRAVLEAPLGQQPEFSGGEAPVGRQQASIGEENVVVKIDTKNEGKKEQKVVSDSCFEVGLSLGLAPMNEDYGAAEAETFVKDLNEECMQLEPSAVNSKLHSCNLQINPMSHDLVVVESSSMLEVSSLSLVGAKNTKKKMQHQKPQSVAKTRGPKKPLEGGKAMVLTKRKANRKRFPATVDNIIRHLKLLNLKEVNALVLSQGSDKRRIFPKVDVDEVTVREWRWLTTRAHGVSKEKRDEDQKWWEAERELYQRRAKVFISILELIQGPRGFIPWKGSVVDSVVGVWLTQNVSDLNSSRAVMAIRSIFGFQSRSSIGTCDEVSEFIKLIESTGDFQVNHYYVSEPEEDESLTTSNEIEISDDVTCLVDPDDQQAAWFESATMDKEFYLKEIRKNPETLENESRVNCANGKMRSELEVGDTPVSFSSYYREIPVSESIEPASIPIRLTNQRQTCEKAKDGQNFPGMSSGATGSSNRRGRKNKVEENKVEKRNWDDLRKKYSRERGADHMDSVDWEAVRCANFVNIAMAIQGRGQHFIIAKKIQNFLNRVVELHGSIDLEWLRYAPPDDVKEYLMEFNGLGPKSVDCIRLLALEQGAFPVDTNVGRLAVRLGWVPLKQLPKDIPFHQLKKYPSLESIQKYLWPRLCKLDHRTLYKLHYHMITFGKVFCTQIKPNCNSCPLRPYCKYYASTIASQNNCLLKSSEKDGETISDVKLTGTHGLQVEKPTDATTIPLLLIRDNSFIELNSTKDDQAFLVEQPQSPEIEDMFRHISSNDKEISSVIVNDEKLHANLQTLLDDYSSTINLSQALVPFFTKPTSMPTPLKKISRRRTIHQVYELPDNHELLAGLKPREKSDKVPYLLAIWTPGETANTCELPKTKCNQGKELCDDQSCISCESIREERKGVVRGTILIPCKTALEGKFPLNGTYFQVNEVFADHYSSYQPFILPRRLICHLRKQMVFFGTTISEIFKDLRTKETQLIFSRGFICIRGFNRFTGILERLAARFHCAPRTMKNGQKRNISGSETKAANTELTLQVSATTAQMETNHTNLQITGKVGVDFPITYMQPR